MIMPTLTGDYDAGGGLREKEKKKLSATDERDIGAGDEELKMTMRW